MNSLIVLTLSIFNKYIHTNSVSSLDVISSSYRSLLLSIISRLNNLQIGVMKAPFINIFDKFSDERIIRLARTQNCKGLDFPIVLFYLNDFTSFSQFGIKQFDNATIDIMNRNMIYTAITRSIEMLHVFTLSDSTAAPINDLKAILKTETK